MWFESQTESGKNKEMFRRNKPENIAPAAFRFFSILDFSGVRKNDFHPHPRFIHSKDSCMTGDPKTTQTEEGK
jgi:hypothetical protein